MNWSDHACYRLDLAEEFLSEARQDTAETCFALAQEIGSRWLKAPTDEGSAAETL